MKLREFQLPTKIEWTDLKDNYGKLSSEPFEKGYGHTIGNSIRRILLSSLEGAAITSVKIEGVPHEYSTMEGVKEDVIEIIFNLKKLRFKVYAEDIQKVKLSVKGEKEVKGADFKLNESVKIMNPQQHIATLSDNSSLDMEVFIERGRGYITAGEQQHDNMEIGRIPIDASFSPVKKVNYDIESSRVGKAVDYDRLVLEVWTDGSVKPPEAVAYASEILKKTTEAFSLPGIEVEICSEKDAEEEEIKEDIMELPLEELKLGTRLKNILESEEIKNIGSLITKTKDEIGDLPGLGNKYMEELEDKIKKFNKERETEISLK